MKKQIVTLTFVLFVGAVLNYNTANAQCNSCSMTGDTQIGTGQSKTYSASTLSGASYFWSVTGNLSISGSNTGSSVTVTGGQSSGSGKVCVTRYKTNTQPCCSCIDITVSGGTPPECPYFAPNIYAINMRTGEANTICPSDVTALGIDGQYGGLQGHTVQWTISPNAPINTGSLTNPYVEFIDLSQYSQYEIKATFYCANGQASGSRSLSINQTLLNCDWIYPTIVAPGDDSKDEVSLYPNPSNLLVTLKLLESEFAHSISIVNKGGVQVYEGKTEKTSVEIDISQLKPDIYFVNISRSDKWAKQIYFLKK